MPPAVVRFLIRAFARLPLSVPRGLGRLVGRLLTLFPNRESLTARVNLELCFPELEPEARGQLLRRTLVANATTVLEMPYAWLRPPEQLIGLCDGHQIEVEIDRLRQRGKGLILAAPHMGNWEIGVHFLASLGPMAVLYRPPRQAALEPLLVSGRGRDQTELVPTTRAGIQTLIRTLRRGDMVAILPDQQPKVKTGSAGVFAPFFGQPALTMTLVSRLAARTGAPVLLVFSVRTPAGRFQGHAIEAPPEIASEDPLIAATALNRAIEDCVRVAPEQYQWTYQRFKARPDGGISPYRQAMNSG